MSHHPHSANLPHARQIGAVCLRVRSRQHIIAITRCARRRKQMATNLFKTPSFQCSFSRSCLSYVCSLPTLACNMSQEHAHVLEGGTRFRQPEHPALQIDVCRAALRQCDDAPRRRREFTHKRLIARLECSQHLLNIPPAICSASRCRALGNTRTHSKFHDAFACTQHPPSATPTRYRIRSFRAHVECAQPGGIFFD